MVIPLLLTCVRTLLVTITAPRIASGRCVINGNGSITVTGKAVVDLIVTVGRITALSTCKPPSMAIGIGRLSTRKANQAK